MTSAEQASFLMPSDSPRASTSQTADGAESRLTLQASGITLLGVLLSIGTTVGFGVPGPWWTGLAAGVATTVALAILVWFLGTRTSVLVRLTDWITGRSYR